MGKENISSLNESMKNARGGGTERAEGTLRLFQTAFSPSVLIPELCHLSYYSVRKRGQGKGNNVPSFLS